MAVSLHMVKRELVSSRLIAAITEKTSMNRKELYN